MAFHFSKRKLRPKEEEETGELNIVPYLDIMMNLIMFMLLSMTGLAAFGILNVNAPSYGGHIAGDLSCHGRELPDPGERRAGNGVAVARGLGDVPLDSLVARQRGALHDRRLPLAEQARFIEQHDRIWRQVRGRTDFHAHVDPSGRGKLDRLNASLHDASDDDGVTDVRVTDVAEAGDDIALPLADVALLHPHE
jgi:hypothetical protein